MTNFEVGDKVELKPKEWTERRRSKTGVVVSLGRQLASGERMIVVHRNGLKTTEHWHPALWVRRAAE